MQPRYKIVIDDFAGVVVTEPTDRRPVRQPANDNGQGTLAENIRRTLARPPACICRRMEELDEMGLLDSMPALRCPIHRPRS